MNPMEELPKEMVVLLLSVIIIAVGIAFTSEVATMTEISPGEPLAGTWDQYSVSAEVAWGLAASLLIGGPSLVVYLYAIRGR